MAFRKRPDPEPERPARSVAPRSLVSSSMKVSFEDGQGFANWRWRDQAWQRELWRLYDIVPEFSYAANWVGNCCSQVRIYVADVDKLGRVQGETTKPKINALAEKVLGGPAKQREALRACGINLTVAGELYLLGKVDKRDRDEWYVLSSSEIRRIKGDPYWGDRDKPQLVDLSRDRVTRVWTPHPQRIWLANSPARPCQPVLRELEQLTKYIFSQIDSRLVSGGILVIPNNLDFPATDNNDVSLTAGDSLMMKLATAGAQSLRGEGTAMAVLPHIVESDPEAIEGWKLIQFDSELSKQALELRAEAIRRLALGLDMPPEALTGMGDANHWNSWFIDGYGIKVHIEPIMNRICEALSEAYLYPALKLMGEDPDRFMYSYDTSPLNVRPQRLQDALSLYEKQLLSAAAVREAGYFKESDAPSDEETADRKTTEVVLRDPNYFAKQGVRELMGITPEMLPQEEFMLAAPGQPGMPGMPGAPGAGPPPPMPPPTGIEPAMAGQGVPDTQGEITPPPGSLPGQPGRPSQQSVVASASREELGLLVLAEAVVHRALELAGKRLLDRHNRDRWPDVPHFDLHTRIRVTDGAHAARLLAGAWDQLPVLAKVLDPSLDVSALRQTLARYCTMLLVNATPHEPKNLLTMLAAGQLVSDDHG